MAPRLLCGNNVFLNAMLQVIVEHGGEGVMMRRVGSYYEYGRSPALLKLKKVYFNLFYIIYICLNLYIDRTLVPIWKGL